jgi:hypothetical protein
MKQIEFKSKGKISKVDVTGDTLTGRGGLALFESGQHLRSFVRCFRSHTEEREGATRDRDPLPIVKTKNGGTFWCIVWEACSEFKETACLK